MPLYDIREYVPNFLSITRIFLCFAFVFFVHINNFYCAFPVFVCASVTDFLDGYLARKWNAESDFGKFLDPLADKILIISSYCIFAYSGNIPLYLVVAVVLRDILIMFVVLLCVMKKISLKITPLISSKINTVLQLCYIILILTCKCFSINVPLALGVCSLVVFISTFLSAAEYVKEYYWIRNAICKSK